MFLRDETEGNNDNRSTYFGNRGEKMEVFNQQIQDEVIEAKVYANYKHITEKLGMAA